MTRDIEGWKRSFFIVKTWKPLLVSSFRPQNRTETISAVRIGSTALHTYQDSLSTGRTLSTRRRAFISLTDGNRCNLQSHLLLKKIIDLTSGCNHSQERLWQVTSMSLM